MLPMISADFMVSVCDTWLSGDIFAASAVRISSRDNAERFVHPIQHSREGWKIEVVAFSGLIYYAGFRVTP